MTFTSWQFGLFVAIVFVTYYLPLVRPFQVQLLVLSSLFFYSYEQLELLPMLAIAVLGTYLCLVLARQARWIWLPVGIAFNLGLLAFFKYKFLFFDPAVVSVGFSVADFLLRLPLPIGISFFTFQGISLVVEVFRDKHSPGKATGHDTHQVVPHSFSEHLRNTALFKSFFPYLVAGPIVNLAVSDNAPVQRGQLLFEIDPRPFQAALDQLTAMAGHLVTFHTALSLLDARTGACQIGRRR